MKIVHKHQTSVASTNTWAKNEREFIEQETLYVYTCDEQYAGRGRLGRSWISKRDKTITLSFALICDNKDMPRFVFSQLACLVVTKLLAIYGLSACIKWPNDILVHKKKIAGILVEQISNKADQNIIIVGIGLNVNSSEQDMQEIVNSVTSYFIETQKILVIPQLIQKMTSHFQEGLDIIFQEKSATIQDQWLKQASWMIAQDIYVSIKKENNTIEKVLARVLSLTPSGDIVVECVEDRKKIALTSQDIVLCES